MSMQPREQGDTGVDIESNETAETAETAPARTSADAGRPGRLRGRRLAAAVLVAGAGLLALPLQAAGAEDHLRLQHRSEHRIPISGAVGPTRHRESLATSKHSSSGPATMRVAIRSRQFKSG